MERTFAQRLADLRNENSVTQKDAAAAIGVSQALLSHYEKGIRECSLDFVARASDYYKVTCDYLLGKSSLKRGFGEGIFYLADIPEDEKLDSLTVFRISSVLRERLRNQPPEYGDVFLKYFALSMYRFLVAAVNAGDLPRNWIGEDTPIENVVYAEMLDGLENVLLDRIERGSQRMPFFDTPLCIKTLVNEMEEYISAQVKGLRYLSE